MIMHAIPGLGRAAGTSVFCADLCEQLVGIGERSRIVLPASPGDDLYPTPPAVEVGVFTPRSPRPEIIHLHSLWHPFLHRVANWARSTNIPLVISPHGMLTPWALQHRRWKKQLALILYQRRDLVTAALLHATSESEVEDIRRMGLWQPVVLAPLGVQIPVPAPANNPGRAGGQDRTVLSVARLHPQKGLVNLVRAWAAVVRDGDVATGAASRWRLVIAGPDQAGHRAELETLAKSLGLTVGERAPPLASHEAWTADVTFTGPVFDDDKTSLYRRTDLFVLPSYSENFGVVVPEALACGVPVIATKGTPWAELDRVPWATAASDRPARAGWWIDIGVEPLRDALQAAMRLTDRERAAIGIQGIELVRQRYGWERVVRDMQAAYHWLLRGGPTPTCIRLSGGSQTAFSA